jgi:hypothetical protein
VSGLFVAAQKNKADAEASAQVQPPLEYKDRFKARLPDIGRIIGRYRILASIL